MGESLDFRRGSVGVGGLGSEDGGVEVSVDGVGGGEGGGVGGGGGGGGGEGGGMGGGCGGTGGGGGEGGGVDGGVVGGEGGGGGEDTASAARPPSRTRHGIIQPTPTESITP